MVDKPRPCHGERGFSGGVLPEAARLNDRLPPPRLLDLGEALVFDAQGRLIEKEPVRG